MPPRLVGRRAQLAAWRRGRPNYLSQPIFYAKMALLGTILLLEIWPMVTLIGWRILIHRGATVDTQPAQAFARISEIQAVLVVLMVFAATALARGVFLQAKPHDARGVTFETVRSGVALIGRVETG